MKTLALIFFSTLLFPVVGQVKDDLRLVNDFDPRQGCETLEIWIDGALAEASNDSQSTAIVVIHQGKNAFDNASVHRKAFNHARFRGFPVERYKVVLTKSTGDIRVKIWIGKNQREPSVAAAKLDMSLPRGTSRYYIIEDTLELVQIDGKGTYIGTGNPSCLYFFAPWLIADLLKANPGFDAEFRIKAKSTITYRKLVKLVKNEFLESGVPTGRLRFIYARDKDLGGGGAGEYASISAFLVKQVRK